MFRIPVGFRHLRPLCHKCSFLIDRNIRGGGRLNHLPIIDNGLLCFVLRNEISLLTKRFSDNNTLKTPYLDKKPLEKQNSSPVITLIGTDNNQTILSLTDAERLAKRRNLKLVNVVSLDTKTQRPIYRLMTTTQYYEEEPSKLVKQVKKSGSSKGDKLLTFSDRITEHDLSSRLKNVKKWLAKSYEVKVLINGDANNMTSAEEVYDRIVVGLGPEGRIVQKRLKGSGIRFQILPPKKTEQQS